MSLLEASRILELHPQFADSGLLGSWALNTLGYLKFVKTVVVSNAAQTQEYLCFQNSADFVRSHYLK